MYIDKFKDFRVSGGLTRTEPRRGCIMEVYGNCQFILIVPTLWLATVIAEHPVGRP